MESKVVASLILLIFGFSSVGAIDRRDVGIEANPIRILGRPAESSLVAEDRVLKEPLDKTSELSQHPTFTHDKNISQFSLRRLFRFLRKKWRSSRERLREFIKAKWRSSRKRLREFIKALKNQIDSFKNQATSTSAPPPSPKITIASNTQKSVENESSSKPSLPPLSKVDQEKIAVIRQDLSKLSEYYELYHSRHRIPRQRIWVFDPNYTSSKILAAYQKNLSYLPDLLANLLPIRYDEILIHTLYKDKNKTDSKLPYLPPEMIDLISQKTMENVGHSILQDLKERMSSRSAIKGLRWLSAQRPKLHLDFWQYILKSWDYLIKNQLLTTTAIATLFDDKCPTLLEELISYMKNFVAEDQGRLFLRESHPMTENWYWVSVHGSLKDLKGPILDRINLIDPNWNKRIGTYWNWQAVAGW